MENCKLLLFDLDRTLLRSDKTISERTLRALHVCREKGILIGVSTSRSGQNALSFTGKLQPGILITSGGALVKYTDIGMLKLCGKGIAMVNAINEVKEKADLVIGSNGEDGIAKYLESGNMEWMQ